MFNEKRFDIYIEQATFGTSTKIITDKETGVQYLFFESGHCGGLTVLLDRDGKPLLASTDDN